MLGFTPLQIPQGIKVGEAPGTAKSLCSLYMYFCGVMAVVHSFLKLHMKSKFAPLMHMSKPTQQSIRSILNSRTNTKQGYPKLRKQFELEKQHKGTQN